MRTRPLETLIIGAYVRGLSDRDIEALVAEAGLGKVSKSTVSEICRQLRSRYQAFRARSVAEVELLVLFRDANLPAHPPQRGQEGGPGGVGVCHGRHPSPARCVPGPAGAS